MSGAPGGKSLELMQRRMLSGQAPAPAPTAPSAAPLASTQPPQTTGQQPPAQQPQVGVLQATNPAPRPGKSAASLVATQAREQATVAQQQQQPKQEQAPAPSPPNGRPKGKDFAAMAMKSRSPAPAPVAAPAAPAPAPAIAPGGRPKGKDFSAMANRIGGSQPPSGAQPSNSHLPLTQRIQFTPEEDEAQKARARKMQAAARAAAGLPPLETLTATSVTTIPPPISPPKAHTRPQPVTQDARHSLQFQKQPQQQYMQQQPVPNRHQQQQQAMRRTSPSARTKVEHAAAYAPQPRMTAPPVEVEGRLSKASKGKSAAAARANSSSRTTSSTPAEKPTNGAPHMAPLLGDRIQDILNAIDPNYVMETEAEEQVLQLADDFLDKVIRQSLRLAQHRGSKSLDVQDVQMILAKHWGIVIPGLGLPYIRPFKASKQSSSKSSSSGGQSNANKRKGPADSAPGNRKKPNMASAPQAS
ncbi:unnamed protein product [Cylindrotheca closterium]|uniref:Transcription initiation factor TFIID subunit 12 domain-containing protein n=1 Tax=Cylindrotheca closterium TaxID=2856 RepID=A0AAD2FE32_9STRA|nr:unnamed protein product [Cylindrotheca closterium]